MTTPVVGIEIEPRTYAPGDSVRGRVRVLSDRAARGLDVVLRYREASPGRNHVAREHGRQRLAEGALAAGARYEFALTLPPDALPPYGSLRARLVWEVAARVDVRGSDPQAAVEITVAGAGAAWM
ncbi:MAG: hypothetical protein QOJ07_701 [Thermoleophilaceae bacterium]|nr:hypothetical protein [Thermoleophilaceae bacterium]